MNNRIFIIINSLGRGGAEKSILSLYDFLTRSQIDVWLIVVFDHEAEYEISDDTKSKIVRLGSRNIFQGYCKIYNLISKKSPSFVFSLMPQSNILNVSLSIFNRAKTFTSERTTPTLFYRSKLKLYIALVPHIFSNKAVFISHYAMENGLPIGFMRQLIHRNATILHNPVVARRSLALAARERSKRTERLRRWAQSGPDEEVSPIQLLIASRLVDGKGILEFLENSLGLLRTKDIEISIAGEGPLCAEILAFRDRHHVGQGLHILNYVSNITDAFKAADIVVLTSKSEGFGRVGFEAYLDGCYVLGTHENSFPMELVESAPAWRIAKSLLQPDEEIRALASVAHIPDQSDIFDLAEALSIERHANQFLKILGLPAIERTYVNDDLAEQ